MHDLLSPPTPLSLLRLFLYPGASCSPYLSSQTQPHQSILPGSLTWNWPVHLPQWPGICSSLLRWFSLLMYLNSAHPYWVFLMWQGLGRLMSLEDTELAKGPPMFNSSSNRGSLTQCVWHLAGNQQTFWMNGWKDRRMKWQMVFSALWRTLPQMLPENKRRRSNESNLKEIHPEYSLEGLMLKLKMQYIDHLMHRADSLEKDPDAEKDGRQKENAAAEDEMVGWHYRRNGHELEQTLGDGEGQGSLVCWSPWGHKDLVTEQDHTAFPPILSDGASNSTWAWLVSLCNRQCLLSI